MQRMDVAVVTGATSGVGREAALAFARRGVRVGLIARGEGRLAAVCAEIAAIAGREAVACASADVGDADQVEAAAARLEAALGPLDAWVNNAAATVFSPLSEMTAAEFRRITDVCYLGYVHGTMAALRRMRPRGTGVVVQVSSAVAFRAVPFQSAYSGAKHAIMGFTNAVRGELIAEDSPVRLTLVHLPAVDTPHYAAAGNRLGRRQGPIPPFIPAAEAGKAVVDAAFEAPREVWVGRQTLQALFANMLAPELLDHFLAGRLGTADTAGAEPAREGNLWRSLEDAAARSDASEAGSPLDAWAVPAPALPPLGAAAARWLGAHWPWR